jgi:hypothetical protein
VESQNGFRVWRGCPDGIWNLKTTLRKLEASGLGCWLLLLDLVKAFDRCDRTLLSVGSDGEARGTADGALLGAEGASREGGRQVQRRRR